MLLEFLLIKFTVGPTMPASPCTPGLPSCPGIPAGPIGPGGPFFENRSIIINSKNKHMSLNLQVLRALPEWQKNEQKIIVLKLYRYL